MHLSRPASIFTLVALTVVALAGCHQKASIEKVAEAKPKMPMPLDLTKYKPNELGVVPILEYHELTPPGKKPHAYMYPLASFAADMQRLYKLGYRPIGLHDYIDGHIDIPAGTSPVVITFDDALRGQVDFDDQGQISPDCAAGILEDMHTNHPDWPLKATFFVLPMKGTEEYFYQKEFSTQKLQWLSQQGFEIGNHTLHHLLGIRSWPDTKVMAEFAGAQALIDQNVPGYKVDLLALPFGVYPKNQKLVISGTSGGVTYNNVCALLAGAEPAPSMASKKFKPYRVPRVIPGNGALEIKYWLDDLEKHKGKKYISDGDPNTITVASSQVDGVATDRLYKDGLFFRSYDGLKLTNIPLAPPTK